MFRLMAVTAAILVGGFFAWLRFSRVRALACTALCPGLGIAYAVLIYFGDAHFALLEASGVPYGKLSSLTPGKSLGNLLEIPLAALLGAVAAVILAGDTRRDRFRAPRFVLGWYLAAALLYFFLPMAPE